MDQNWCEHKNMLGNSHGNFQLHRFTTSENIAKNFRGGATFFDSHCITIYVVSNSSLLGHHSKHAIWRRPPSFNSRLVCPSLHQPTEFQQNQTIRGWRLNK